MRARPSGSRRGLVEVAVVAIAAAVVVAGGAPACMPHEAPVRGALPFVDDFSDAALGRRYFMQGGSWRVVDGALTTLGDRNLPLWLDVPLPRDVRIEFTVTSSSPAVDAKVEVFGDGVRHESGYVVVLGGWSNTLSGIARRDEHERGRVMHKTRFEQGRRYRVVVERRDGRSLVFSVDDAVVARYDDADPLSGPGHDRFAFSGWESEVAFDDLRITPLPSPSSSEASSPSSSPPSPPAP
jgi:hypothetical protein